MKKTIWIWLAACVMVMIALPGLVIAFVPPHDVMAYILLELFVINPVFCVLVGLWAGKDFRNRWFLPLVAVVLFLAGAWLFNEAWEPAFLLYAAFNLGLSAAAMLVPALFSKRGNPR